MAYSPLVSFGCIVRGRVGVGKTKTRESLAGTSKRRKISPTPYGSSAAAGTAALGSGALLGRRSLNRHEKAGVLAEEKTIPSVLSSKRRELKSPHGPGRCRHLQARCFRRSERNGDRVSTFVPGAEPASGSNLDSPAFPQRRSTQGYRGRFCLPTVSTRIYRHQPRNKEKKSSSKLSNRSSADEAREKGVLSTSCTEFPRRPEVRNTSSTGRFPAGLDGAWE